MKHHSLQYISQGETEAEQLYNIQKVLDAGGDWIQLRFKNGSPKALHTVGEKVKQWCERYKATFIVNDKVDLAKNLDADGVHLGLEDMPPQMARAVLGAYKIIGGTANTLADVIYHAQSTCDYIGLGPFRITPTKEKLSPVLGLEGYKSILDQLPKHNINCPIIAIGGIQLPDVIPLMQTGIHGLAISGLLTQKPTLITTLKEKLYDKF